jgi:sulfonate transport system ATP-binding protein
LNGVSRSFAIPAGVHHVLHDVDLTIAAGEIVALIGASGCGKSTLLREISGLDRPDAGDIVIGDAPVRGIDARCATAFQEPRLMPWRSARDNIALGLPRGTSRSDGNRRVEQLLELVGLTDAGDRRPREISGGMAQRVSLARALARNPAVLLLDEPFGALDALTRLRMQDLLLDIHATEPTTVVLVTHDVEEALYLADRVALIGAATAGGGSEVRSLITVPGQRPRDRGDADLAALRADLLEGLGVASHH